MHSHMDHFLQGKLKLFQFVRQYDRALRSIRQTELSLDFTDSVLKPILMTHLKVFETHASTVYTRAIFRTMRSNIAKEMYFYIS